MHRLSIVSKYLSLYSQQQIRLYTLDIPLLFQGLFFLFPTLIPLSGVMSMNVDVHPSKAYAFEKMDGLCEEWHENKKSEHGDDDW
jgi:hypothetical protein